MERRCLVRCSSPLPVVYSLGGLGGISISRGKRGEKTSPQCEYIHIAGWAWPPPQRQTYDITSCYFQELSSRICAID